MLIRISSEEVTMDERKELQPLEDIATLLVNETDPDKTKRLINLFNLNFAKKNALRLDSISELIDDVIEKIGQRLQLRPDEFSNKDLIDYLNALYQAAEKSNKVVDGVDEIPAITFNQQNNVVVNTVDSLSRESKQRIAAAVAAILNQTKTQGEIENADEEDGSNQ